MFNSQTFFGTDGSLTLSNAVGFAADTFTDYFGESGIVGRVVNVSIAATTQIHPFHQLGSRSPKELRVGRVAISGSVERAFINGALLRLMLGPYAEGEETPGMNVPNFNLTVLLDHPMFPEDQGNSVLTVYGVMFDSWQWQLSERDFALERLSFKARRMAVVDQPTG